MADSKLTRRSSVDSTASEQKLVSRSPIVHKTERPPRLNLNTAKLFGTNQLQDVCNASYAAGSKPSRPSLTAKKSSPDMRLAMPKSAAITLALPRSAEVPSRAMAESPRGPTSRSPSCQDSGFSEGCSESVRVSIDAVIMSSAIVDRPPSVTPIDVERNSYFRRLSTSPPSIVYQTLQHYTVYVINERLSTVLLKVLDSATARCRLSTLSTVWMPQAGDPSLPPSSSLRGTIFGIPTTIIGALQCGGRNLKLVARHLTAHGGDRAPAEGMLTTSSSELPQNQVSSGSRSQVSPYILFASPASHPPSPFIPHPRTILRSYSTQFPGAENERTRMMRKHGGSFSCKDVGVGKMLPSHPTYDPPSSSSAFLDDEAIDVMRVAVDTAPSVWRSETLVGDVVPAKFNILISAKALTQRLSDNIKVVRESDAIADRRTLRDDATVFAKTVILLCNAFKNQGTEGPLSTDLRANMILLMNAIEESVVLLHVPSFSPSTSRPYSPLVSTGSGFGLSTPGFGASFPPSLTTGGSGEDTKDFRVGSGIIATKGALQPNNSRPGLYNPSAATPRAQIPYQGFGVPSFMRFDSKGRYGGLTSGDES
ncbi:hypothetical protein BDM02DRAFT_3131847 [Thelephora ganbajun]|uniref:Uncharacterized protein n=1 Tax=Thelephora ganbajun TaxID=370292 RepID=A0ACB6Z3S4_THEGA|nr:hypothetical protein BDM02DRAFT_3131847 [Thelephora ganbajun]